MRSNYERNEALMSKIILYVIFPAIGALAALFTIVGGLSTAFPTAAKPQVLVREAEGRADYLEAGRNAFNIEIINKDSKAVDYFMTVATDIGTVRSNDPAEKHTYTKFTSRLISLGAGKAITHDLFIDADKNHAVAHFGAPKENPLRYMGNHNYFLNIELHDANENEVFYSSTCRYEYENLGVMQEGFRRVQDRELSDKPDNCVLGRFLVVE